MNTKLKSLNCHEADYEITNVDKISKEVKLFVESIKDELLPTVSIVIPTYNRQEFTELLLRNWFSINYPRDKLELVVLDDSKNAKCPYLLLNKPNVKYITNKKKMTIGEKRNILCKEASNEYIVHMDDDDWYHQDSVITRIRVLLEYEKKIGKKACFGCTKVNCMDLITGQMFEAYDPADDGKPATISESTMAYSKQYWELQKFDNLSTETECLPFIENRHDTLCTCPSEFIVTQFSHGHNTINRRIHNVVMSEYNSLMFEQNLTAVDSKTYNITRAKVISKIPSFSEAINIFQQCSNDPNKFKKKYKYMSKELKENPLIINMYQTTMTSKKTSTGKDIVYYCGPGYYFKFSNKWNPSSKQIGGSEEAVIGLSKELVKRGYNVTVYCVLEGSSKIYDGVLYKQYYEWLPMDKQDVTIVWRDPSNTSLTINSNKVLLDLHDAIDSSWLNGVPKSVTIMSKSRFHRRLLQSVSAQTIPNGIYTIDDNTDYIDNKVDGLMVCTSSPERCIRALLKILPLVRKEIPHAELHWAYGFSSSITNSGGLEKDPRTRDWVVETRELIAKTDGFVDLGRLSQTEVNELYKKADVFVYPTLFPEIDCISLSKAMYYGCIPIVTPSGSMSEKIGSSSQIYDKNPTSFDYSIYKDNMLELFANTIIKILKTKMENRIKYIKHAKGMYSWDVITDRWIENF